LPIVNAKVEIWKDGVLIDTLYTDSEGRANKTLEIGEYEIIISKTGYQTITKTETISTRTELMVNLPEAIAVGAHDVDVTLTLMKDYTLASTSKTLNLTLTYEKLVA